MNKKIQSKKLKTQILNGTHRLTVAQRNQYLCIKNSHVCTFIGLKEIWMTRLASVLQDES